MSDDLYRLLGGSSPENNLAEEYARIIDHIGRFTGAVEDGNLYYAWEKAAELRTRLENFERRLEQEVTGNGETSQKFTGGSLDGQKVAAGLDCSDWLHIADRHQQTSHRGRIETQAYPLRPILAAVQAGDCGPEELREKIRRIISAAAAETGRTPSTVTPRWLGFGPTLVNRKD